MRVSHRGRRTRSTTGEMPDICMQHMVAVMLLDGTATFQAAHDESACATRRCSRCGRRVELYGDDALQRAMPSRQGIVELTLQRRPAGCTITRRTCAAPREPDDARGGGREVLSAACVRARQEARAAPDRRGVGHRARRATCGRCGRCSGPSASRGGAGAPTLFVRGCAPASVSGTVVRDGARSRCVTGASTCRGCSLVPHPARAHRVAAAPPVTRRAADTDELGF